MILDRQLLIIAGMLRNRGLPGMKLTLIARHPDDPGKWIVSTDDDLAKARETLDRATAQPGKEAPHE